MLDPVLKSLVGRLRPVVANPIAHGTGNSFPSGHSLGSSGLEPEVRADLRPARPERAAGGRALHRGRLAAGLLIAWGLIFGIVVGIGELVTRYGNGNVLGDRTY